MFFDSICPLTTTDRAVVLDALTKLIFKETSSSDRCAIFSALNRVTPNERVAVLEASQPFCEEDLRGKMLSRSDVGEIIQSIGKIPSAKRTAVLAEVKDFIESRYTAERRKTEILSAIGKVQPASVNLAKARPFCTCEYSEYHQIHDIICAIPAFLMKHGHQLLQQVRNTIPMQESPLFQKSVKSHQRADHPCSNT